jgi:hypothetical protein
VINGVIRWNQRRIQFKKHPRTMKIEERGQLGFHTTRIKGRTPTARSRAIEQSKGTIVYLVVEKEEW